MGVTDEQRSQWRRDTEELAGLAGRWRDDEVTVTVPRPIAERAVEAWERTDEPGGELGAETDEQARERAAAGTFALVGAAIAERGRWSADGVTVRLSLEVVGDVLAAACGSELP